MAGRTSDAKLTKVSRYRPGHIPTFAKDHISEKEAALEHKQVLKIGRRPNKRPTTDLKQQSKPKPKKELPVPKQEVEETKEDTDVQIRARSLVTPQLLDLDEDDDKIVGMSDDDSEDEEEFARRRQRLRQKAEEEEEIDKERIIQAPTKVESESESSEWETDSDAEEEEFNEYRESIRASAPVFVSKKDRITLEVENEEEEGEDEELRKQKRAEETKAFLQEAVVVIAKEEENMESDEEGDPKEEYEKWKVREIERLVNEFKIRNPEAIQSDDEDSKIQRKKERKQMKFMQKYYHKGAFYQDEEVVQKQDATAPTLEDRMDITLLPKIMQVKNFGKRGRTKYTHLADVDTTDRSFGWGDSLSRNKKRDEHSPPSKRQRVD